MIGKWYFLLSILQVVVSEEWTADIQQEVTVRKGLCAHIRCQYSYPSRLANDQRVGIWFNSNNLFSWSQIAFHSKNSSHIMPKYHHRTWLSGNLNDKNCSLNINNVTQEDEGPYHFRIEFKDLDRYSYSTITQLRVDVSGQSRANTPRVVTAQRGLCAFIPCHYQSEKKTRDGIWLKDECSTQTVIFHSSDPNRESPGFHHRTRLSGDLRNGDCSLIIDNVTEKDEGTYYFKIEFGKGEQFVHLSITHLRITASEKWRVHVKESITVQRGMCAWIPCHFSYPSCLANETRDGIWVKGGNQSHLPVAFHSMDRNKETLKFKRRTWLAGDLKDDNCSLVINNITQEDEGSYTFRIKFKNQDQYSYHSITQLNVTVSEEWRADTPQDVTAQRGLCARIPCHYSYPLHVDNKPWDGIWMKDECLTQTVTFHSKHQSRVSPRFHRRTRLSGKMKDGDCSLVIDNIMQEDEGYYYFKIASENVDRHSYLPTTQLHVTDFTDKPSIFPAEMVAGKPVNISCTFNITCGGSTPNFTWITPTDVLALNSSSVTEWGDTLTYTAVLTLTPALKHHGQNLTCRVKYPPVSSEQTVTLTVRLELSLQEMLIVSLAAAAGVVALIILVTLTWFVLQSRCRTNRPVGNRGKPEDKSETVLVRERLKMEEHYYTNCAQPELTQEKAKKDPEYKLNWNENADHNVYENFDEDSIYANM
ncbi:sialic acid-binding Ig-like lectin 12 [Mobula hypostoma]|uniref:sialic acid-binding Ig-like lectin 12 n=1 Tax=Mobula hypostoma TaxID=723540 RepID=UPI002FC2B03D